MDKPFERSLFFFLYLIAMFGDCYLLYNGQFEDRIYTKPMMMPCLGIYMLTRVMVDIEADKFRQISLVLAAIVVSWASDILAILSDSLAHTACVSLYLFIYPLYFILLTTILQKGLSTEAKVKKNKRWLVLFIVILPIAGLFFRRVLHLVFSWDNIPFYLDGLMLVSLLAATVATVSVQKRTSIIYMLLPAVLFMIIANMAYAYLYFQLTVETSHTWYMIVALGNGLSQLLIITGFLEVFRKERLASDDYERQLRAKWAEQFEAAYKPKQTT